MSENSHDEKQTGDLPDRSSGDAEGALESAASDLRASPPPAGATGARGRSLSTGRQSRDLLAWARENSLLIDPAEYLSGLTQGGEEHRVCHDPARERYFKATYPGRFGFSMVASDDGLPELVNATPLEYLDRLLLQNRVFGDSIRLEGVAEENGRIVVLTGQRNIPGDQATLAEIESFFAGLWFRPLHRLKVANPGSLAFYRDLDELVALDAHQANIVKDEQGRILPIDIIMVQADEALQKALKPFLGQ